MRYLLSLLLFLAGNISLAQVVNRAEYFIDTDPGVGNGTAVTVPSPSAAVTLSFTVPATSLATGFHTLNFRIRESVTGQWSLFHTRNFYIVNASTLPTATSVVKAEYFLDTDPGPGNATAISFTSSAQPSFAFTVSTSTLSSGFHTLNFRTQDELGRWSLFHTRSFYIQPAANLLTSASLVKAEYFFDTDPGTGAAIPLPLTAGDPQNNNFNIDVSTLAPGFHRLAIRYQDNRGQWSLFQLRSFYLQPSASLVNLKKLEYFVDTDPGIGNATAVSVPQTSSVDVPVALDMTGVSSGPHLLYIRAQDESGLWSYAVSAAFVINDCIPPPQPVAADQSRCGEGTVNLTASGATGAQVYRWYDDAVAGILVGTGSPFTTSLLTSTTTFYVSVYDPSTDCESLRVPVKVNVTVIPKPSLNATGTITVCEGNGIVLTAPSGYVQYVWSGGESTQQIVAQQSGNYTVSVGDGLGCLSEPSDPVNLNAISRPAQPVIQITGNTALCGSGSTTLSGPSGFSYLWSTGATTQDITTSLPGNYSLTIRDAIGCTSLPSDVVTITNSIAQATITTEGDLLIASAGDSYQWFRNGVAIAGATSQLLTIALTDFGIYAVEVTVTGCMSRSDDFAYLITAVESSADGLTVSPNPFTDKLLVKNPGGQTGFLILVDALGRVVKEVKINSDLIEVDTYQMATGLYQMVVYLPEAVMVFKVQKV